MYDLKNRAIHLVLLLCVIQIYVSTGCGSGDQAERWNPFPRSCCCLSGCPRGDLICLAACQILGGVCNDPGSEMRRACEGSNILQCTCTEREDSQMAP